MNVDVITHGRIHLRIRCCDEQKRSSMDLTSDRDREQRGIYGEVVTVHASPQGHKLCDGQVDDEIGYLTWLPKQFCTRCKELLPRNC